MLAIRLDLAGNRSVEITAVSELSYDMAAGKHDPESTICSSEPPWETVGNPQRVA